MQEKLSEKYTRRLCGWQAPITQSSVLSEYNSLRHLCARGFSVIELLVVIAVISILIGIAVPRIKGMQDEANRTKAQAETATLKAAIESYYINQNPNAYPASSTTICASTLNSASPLIVADVLTDPFRTGGAEYNYIRSSNGQFYVVFSYGIDGAADITGISDAGVLQGTEDDDIFATNGTGW